MIYPWDGRDRIEGEKSRDAGKSKGVQAQGCSQLEIMPVLHVVQSNNYCGLACRTVFIQVYRMSSVLSGWRARSI